MSIKRIIVNADDLGLCPSVNTAIFEVFRAGNLNSATLMANMPGTDDAVERLSDHQGLAVGLHFCLSEGKALTGSSSLTDGGGHFMPRSSLLKAALRGRLDPSHVRREFIAQWEALQRKHVDLDHVDSHQHVLMFPPIFKIMAPVLEELQVPVRMVHPPFSTVAGDLARPARALKQLLNIGAAALDKTRFNGPVNHRLVSIHDLSSSGPYTASTYQGLIARDKSEAVLEVMVHPYILGADVMDLYAHEAAAKRPFLDRCLAEYEALRGAPIFADQHMVSFRDIPVA